jgi:hypothetical protein
MSKYQTKHFGEISIDETSDFESISANYLDNEINIFLSDCNTYGDKLNTCLNIIDKYSEINAIAKQAILDNYPENETIKYYFECHFDSLDENVLIKVFGIKRFDIFEIKRTVESLEYPDLLFDIQNNEIHFSVDYKITKEYSDEILCVKMDKDLNITGFSHES